MKPNGILKKRNGSGKRSRLKLSVNGKTRFYHSHANALGLMYGLPKDGGTCPGATCGRGGCLYTECKRLTCYADHLKRYLKVVPALKYNTRLLKGKSMWKMVDILAEAVSEFVRKSERFGLKQLAFRIHYSGDFFSMDYAKAWRYVAGMYPRVRFWTYTRSFDALPILTGIKNMNVFISADWVNWRQAELEYSRYKHYPNMGISFMGNMVPPVVKWTKCPAISGRIKSTWDVGACAKCQRCFRQMNQETAVQFPIH